MTVAVRRNRWPWAIWLLWAVLPAACLATPAREVRVGVHSNEPRIFMDASGQPAGVFIDLLHLVAARENWRLSFLPCERQVCLDALHERRIDLLPGVTQSDERRSHLAFHRLPVLHGWSQVYRAPGTAIHSVFDLRGQRVAVLEGSLQKDYFADQMAHFGVKVTLLDVATPAQAFAMVQSGQADAAIANHLFGNLHRVRFGLEDSGIVFQPAALYFAAEPGHNADLLAAIDQHVRVWRSGTDASYSRVLQRWGGQEGGRAAGGVPWGWWSLAAFAALSGLLVLAVLVLRRQVQERTHHLQVNEHKLATILDSVEAYIYIKGTDYRYQYANRHTLELFGCTAQELLGKDDTAFFNAETLLQLRANDSRVLEGGERIEAEEVNTLQADGSTHVYLSVKLPLRKPDGTIVALCGISTEITELRRIEESQRIAATVFESQEGMIVTGPDRCILKVNRAFVRLTGYSEQELIGQSPRLLQSGRQDDTFYRALWQEVAANGQWKGEIWNRRKNGEIYPAWVTISAVKNQEGEVTHYVGTQIDISERKSAEEEIRRLAFYDPLTGLPNRRLMVDRLQHALDSSARTGSGGALLFVDLDNFKDLNDTQGHDVGDELLKQVAARLEGCVRLGDTVARLGGDEFVLLLENLGLGGQDAAAQAEAVGRKVLQALGQTYTLEGHTHHTSCSIGVALFADAHGTVDELLKRGDLSMYQAKAAGRNTLRFFDPRAQVAVTERTALEAGLRQALREQQFVLHYQAQVGPDGQRVGAEALVRWRHPQRGLVLPADFIAAAESSGLIVPLGEWVLRSACVQLAHWAQRPETAGLVLAVNVSARQFRHGGFVDDVLRALQDSGADPSRLKIELTESVLLDDVEGTIARMSELRRWGVAFALDDFGTGFSSLGYLKRLPLDQLKIDQGFVRDVLTDPNDAAIARTIVALAHSLDLGVIAEGVETVEQRDVLASFGCHHWQGHLFGAPGPAQALEEPLGDHGIPVV
ncbi:EAL domain-containing protein [Simplicispira lacusdiani]|uniref:EAL domain-containing protein n=1 Tax=Simplicispira lacusdiani TaxID=2213010 RepID=UPI0027954729|nr:EAL domain-containing protein [Simplicispira lacusdiani]